MRERAVDGNKAAYAIEMIKAVIFSIIVTLVLVLLAALLIKVFSIPTSAIIFINQFIKGVSILLGALVFFKQKSGGFIRGIILGLIYIVLSTLIFSLFDGSFSFSLSLLNDVTFACVSGLISGIIAVNVKK